MKQQVIFQDLGLIDFQRSWDYQEQLFHDIINTKLNNRRHLEQEQKPTTNHLLFCEHPHVYTLGKSGSMNNLLLNNTELQNKNIAFHKINRGGDITYHGPGQLVGYPILDLDLFFTDISKYLSLIEESIILTLQEYAIPAGRIKGATGVWLSPDIPHQARKIAAIGVKCSRWVTMHGFAFNINTNLDYFNSIIPCGIKDKAVTSLQNELGRAVPMDEVKTKLKKHFSNLFNVELVEDTVLQSV